MPSSDLCDPGYPGAAPRAAQKDEAAMRQIAGPRQLDETPASPRPRGRAPFSAAVAVASLVGLTALAVAPAAGADEAGPLTFTVSGLHSEKGTLRCALHDKPDAFPRKPDQAAATAVGQIKGGIATCTFAHPRPGAYAISAFHDENDDGKVNIGLFGPTEGWAASNDARGTFGPSFADARFDFKGPALALKAKIVY